MNTLIDLTGKHVLVIGASSGIGRQTAITLSRIGAKLTLVARTEDKLKTALQELEGEGHAYYVTDISELSGIEEMVKQTIQKNGCLDGMVYAAGISMSMPLQMFKPQKLQSLFDVNFFAFVESVRQATKRRGIRRISATALRKRPWTQRCGVLRRKSPIRGSVSIQWLPE